MSNKLTQKRRMWDYFIDATTEIIKTEGYESVTIRHVAKKAGYNSATIYNYFGDLSHLLFFSSMKLLIPYVDNQIEITTKEDNPITRYIKAWEVFCKHSFENPQIFHAVFIMDLGEQPDLLIEEYYEVYTEETIRIPDNLKSILHHNNLTVRGYSLLQQAIEEQLLSEEDVQTINEMTNLIWKGMLSDMLSNRTKHDTAEAIKVVMDAVKVIMNKFTNKEHPRKLEE